MEQYDSIIIGAGHNGLVCAAYLARGGHRVLVLEAAGSAGGLAASREFHPGFKVSVAHSLCHFSQKVAADLDLAKHGFRSPASTLPTVGLNAGGTHVVVHDGTLTGCSDADADAYREYTRLMHRFADALRPFWFKTMPRISTTGLGDLMTFAHVGLNLRRLGKEDMREFLRIASLPARDLMDEFFDNELLKATLCWDGVIGARLAPRSPNSAVLALLYRMAESSRGAHAIPAAGIDGLIAALAAAATASGAEIRCSAAVDRVLIDESVDGLQATGVQLADGEQIRARHVISATDPQRTFLGLVGVRYLEIDFSNRIRRLRCDGYVGKLHLALSAPPNFDGLEQANGRLIIAPTMDTIEFAFDDAKYGDCSREPVLEVVVPSLHDASVAPAGQHVLSAHVMYVPRDPNNGWTDTARAAIYDRALDTIARYAPGIREQVVHGEFLAPCDLEEQYRVTGGQWHHTEFAVDQMLMMRPTHEAAQYGTPIPGLFLCGAGSHPGGDLTGAAGHNAAHEILR